MSKITWGLQRGITPRLGARLVQEETLVHRYLRMIYSLFPEEGEHIVVKHYLGALSSDSKISLSEMMQSGVIAVSSLSWFMCCVTL